MLHHGIHHLIEAGYSQLFSRYHICNHHSRQFYHKLGFQDRPTPYTLSIRLSYLKNEIWRKEKLKMMEGLDELLQEYEQIEARVEALNQADTFY